jgi:hypothetical protein
VKKLIDMKYYSAILSLFGLSFFIIIALLYLGNVSRNFEKSNIILKKNIVLFKDQININEIEYSLVTNYDYLTKLQKLYLAENIYNQVNNIITFNDLKNKDINNFYTVGMK